MPDDTHYDNFISYTPTEAARFFGRDDEIRVLADKVTHQRLTFVIGPSGSGKSSLVFAGLLPRRTRDAPGRWNVRTMRPGADPLAALAEASGSRPTPPHPNPTGPLLPRSRSRARCRRSGCC